MKKPTFIVLLLGLSHVSAVHAIPDEVEQLLALSLEDLMATKVTISTNTKQALSKAPSVVSVITADDIKATGTTNLMEILQSVPGIYVKNNLFGFKPLITFRGASGANVLLMVNGAPAKDLVWSPSIFWKGVPANMIERIEIIRGPGSALFGSDASAGAINVITRTAAPVDRSEVGVRMGRFDSQSGWIQHGGRWNDLDVAFTADLAHTDGHDPFIARARGNTSGTAHYGWDNADLHLSIGRGHWRLLADHTRHDNVEIGLTGGAVLDPRTRANDRQTALTLVYENPEFARDWGLNAEWRYRDISYTSGNGFWEGIAGVVNLNQMDSSERRVNLEVSATYGGVRNHLLRLGSGFQIQDLYLFRQYWDGVARPLDAPQKRRTTYFFVQDIWSLSNDWEFTGGLRYDRYSDFGGTLNPRLALVWHPTSQLTAKLMYGRAFRAPSYLELYLTTGANPPNANLKPECSRTWEASFSYVPAQDLRLTLNLYEFERKHVIAPETTAPFRFRNFERFATRGAELEAQWQVSRTLRVSGNLSQMHNEDVTSPLRDVAIPLTQAYLRSDWRFMPKWYWNLQASWFDARPLVATDTRARMGSVAVVDTTIRYRHDKRFELAASIRNLFDADVRDYSSTALWNNLPRPGRTVFGELRYAF